jgi:hypothetical protein
MRTAFALLAAAAVAPSAAPAAGGIAGNGEPVTVRREVPAFERVDLRGPIDARIRIGPARAVSLTIDSNLEAHVRTRVEDGTLRVDTDEPIAPRKTARLEVTVPSLRAVSARGSGDVAIEGGEGGEGDLRLEVRGSGDLSWRGKVGALAVALQGSGGATLEGETRSLTASLAGSGDLRGSGLTVRDATVSAQGSGDVEITLAGGTLTASTAGSGDVVWSGEGTVSAASSSGSGRIVHR